MQGLKEGNEKQTQREDEKVEVLDKDKLRRNGQHGKASRLLNSKMPTMMTLVQIRLVSHDNTESKKKRRKRILVSVKRRFIKECAA